MTIQLDPNTRRFLITCRCLAMRGEMDSAVNQIDELLSSSANDISVLDQVALLLLKAEILYLDCRETESLEVFRTEIESKMSLLPQEVKFIVGQNRSDVAMTLIEEGSVRQAARLYDQRQLAGAKFWDPQSMVYAYEAAASGKHYEALPALWRELTNSYYQGVWRYYRQASGRLAKEFIQIGWAHSAEYHVIVARDSELAELIGNHLLNWRQPQLIEGMIQRLLANANLKRHAIVACIIITHVADAISDTQINSVIQWLLSKCSIVLESQSELNLVISAWKAIQSLTPRLNSQQAREIVQTATQHPLWGQTDFLRKELIQAVNGCINVLPSDDLPELARHTLPLATTQKDDIDYGEALNLLHHIAFRGGNNVRDLIGDALYSASPIDLQLVRIAQDFGKRLENEQEATRLAEHFARDVHLQVQQLAPGEEFKKPSISYGTFTIQGEDKHTVISIYSYTGLGAAIAHRSFLQPETIQLLVTAILEMIREPENSLANKVGLINGIIELADSIAPELAATVFDTLAPIASGEVVGLDVTGVAGDPDHPLNPFKVRMGESTKVQGGALYTLACIEAYQPGIYGRRFTDILEQAMADGNNEVRVLAFTAARRAPTLSDALLMRVLLGTRDNDPDVAVAAFRAVNNHPLNTDDFWNLLVYSLTMACNSPNVNVRRVAAFTINKLRSQYPNEEVKNKLHALEEALAVDICHSVRNQISLAVSATE